MSAPVFSVILVNWNTAELTLAAIESVRADAGASGVSVQVIVVDNGSVDDSAARIRTAFPQAQVIENDRNLGFARAVNKGLEVSSGEIVLLLNTDARLEAGALATFKRTFEQTPRIGILGGALLDPDGSPQNCIAPFPNLATELVNKSLLRIFNPTKHTRKVEPGSKDLVRADSIVGACFVIRRETFDAIGPLDERFFFFFEETDWCRRAWDAGWEVAVAPEAKIVHGQGESSKPVLIESRIEFYRSRYRYFLKNQGKMKTILLFEGSLIKLAVEFLSAGAMRILSLGKSQRWRERFRVVSTLLAWHIRGCPKSWGLEGHAPSWPRVFPNA
jgi:hypothetical protein